MSVSNLVLLNASNVARQLVEILPYVAAESGLDLLSPSFCDDYGDLLEIVNMETAARLHAITFGDDADGMPFYYHLIEAFDLVAVPTFYPMEGRDGPWLVGDGVDLWSAPNEITCRMVAAAIEAAGMDPFYEQFVVDDDAADDAGDDAADDAAEGSDSSISIVIQYQEDCPHSSGWWRFGRPRHEIRKQVPEFSEHRRWYYGTEADALRDAQAWDRQHPHG